MLIDTNIWFAMWDKHTPHSTRDDLRQWLEAQPLAAIDTTIYIECLQGQKSNTEKRAIKRYLESYGFVPWMPSTGSEALRLIDTYSNTHNMLLADALIAANALLHGLPVVTYNRKDFRFISGLTLITPPF